MKNNISNITKGILDIFMGILFLTLGVLLIINKYVYPVLNQSLATDDTLTLAISFIMILYSIWRFKRAYDKIKE